MLWSRLSREFITPITLSSNFETSYVLAPLSSIVHPLFIFKHYGDDGAKKYFCSVSKQNWAKYFHNKVVVVENNIDSKDNTEEDNSNENDNIDNNVFSEDASNKYDRSEFENLMEESEEKDLKICVV